MPVHPGAWMGFVSSPAQADVWGFWRALENPMTLLGQERDPRLGKEFSSWGVGW